MKFGQLMEQNQRNVFLQKSYKKWGREASCRPLFVFPKCFILGKKKCSAAWLHCISIALKLAYNKNKLFKTLDYWSRDKFNFDFSDKFLHHILHIIFQQKCSSYYNLLTDQISLSGWLYFLRYWSVYALQLFANLVMTT